jgi:hypothetical protein
MVHIRRSASLVRFDVQCVQCMLAQSTWMMMMRHLYGEHHLTYSSHQRRRKGKRMRKEMDRQRVLMSFKFMKMIARALRGEHDERKQHVRLASEQYGADVIRVPASTSDLLLQQADQHGEEWCHPDPPPATARAEDLSPCPEAHASPSVGNVKSPAIPTRGTLSRKVRASSRSSGRNLPSGARSQRARWSLLLRARVVS